MKRSKFTDSQIMDALKRVDAGLAVPEICRERSFSKWTMVFQGSEEVAKTLPEVTAAIEDVEFPMGHPLLIALRGA